MSEISDTERDMIRHALGLNRSENSTRNYYSAGTADAEIWASLCARGYAFEVAPPSFIPDRMFHVTPAGKHLVGAA